MMPAQTQPNMLPKPKPQKGQGIVEYCLIIVLASVALVSALGVFGSALADEFDSIVDVVISL